MQLLNLLNQFKMKDSTKTGAKQSSSSSDNTEERFDNFLGIGEGIAYKNKMDAETARLKVENEAKANNTNTMILIGSAVMVVAVIIYFVARSTK